MAEKSFDALLYQALLEAGWQENRTAWEGTEEPAFSPQYLRWRTRLLADPFGWGKKQLRPLWAKALRTAACILLAYPTAYGLAKCVGEKHRNLLVVLIIIPFFTSQLLLIYSMMVLLQANGPVMSLLGLFGRNASTSILYTNFAVFLILLYEFLPYMVLCLYSSMCKIEDNQLYAAQVMGAGKARRFLDVIFPLSSPGLLSGIIIVFVPAAGSFVEANLAGGTNGMLIGSYIDTNFSVSLNIGRGCALCVLLSLIHI